MLFPVSIILIILLQKQLTVIIAYKIYTIAFVNTTNLTLILLNTTSHVLANSVGSDKLASEEANWSICIVCH